MSGDGKAFGSGLSSRMKYYVAPLTFPFILMAFSLSSGDGGRPYTSLALMIAFVAVNVPVLWGYMNGKLPPKELILFWWLGPFVVWMLLVVTVNVLWPTA